MHQGKAAIGVLAAAGLVACWFIAATAWDGWEGRPPLAKVSLELALFGLVSAVVLAVAFSAPRAMAIPAALILLVFGWFGTWAYGFLWVPGFAALLACAFRRPAGHQPSDALLVAKV